MRNLAVIFGVFLLLSSCRNNTSDNSGKTVEEIAVGDKTGVADIIRNPVSATEPLDTVNVAKIAFEETIYDFGEVNEGETVAHVFRFTNTGRVPLMISNARSTCGCTVPKWPQTPIPPGEKGEIEVRFNTQNKRDKQSKPVTITANTYPAMTTVHLSGFVKPSSDKESVPGT